MSSFFDSLFETFEDGDFTSTNEHLRFDDASAELRVASSGEVLDDINALIEHADHSICFAYFNIF